MDAATIRQSVSAELPDGTDQRVVVAWLDRHAVEHSGYVPQERVINAIWRDLASKGLTKQSVRVDFVFSADGALEVVRAKDVFTGL